MRIVVLFRSEIQSSLPLIEFGRCEWTNVKGNESSISSSSIGSSIVLYQ